MILYTTYNKYCVSYILLFERIYVGFCFVSLFFSQFVVFFRFVDFFSRCYSMSLSQFSQDGGRMDEGFF